MRPFQKYYEISWQYLQSPVIALTTAVVVVIQESFKIETIEKEIISIIIIKTTFTI